MVGSIISYLIVISFSPRPALSAIFILHKVDTVVGLRRQINGVKFLLAPMLVEAIFSKVSGNASGERHFAKFYTFARSVNFLYNIPLILFF